MNFQSTLSDIKKLCNKLVAYTDEILVGTVCLSLMSHFFFFPRERSSSTDKQATINIIVITVTLSDP